MRLKVYKSLDKSSSLFGIRGSYLRIAGAGAGIAIFVALAFISPVTDGLIGTLSAVALLGLDYVGVMMLQSRYTERELDRWTSIRTLPRFILLQPRPLRFLMRSGGKAGLTEQRSAQASAARS